MRDLDDSKTVRVLAFLVVAIPLLAFVAFFVLFVTTLGVSGGRPLWMAFGLATLMFAGLLVWVLITAWVRRVGRTARRP